MKKEKQVKAHTRRTKSGKTVTVKAHSAKYDAAEAALEAVAKKKGAGKELLSKKTQMNTVDTQLLKDAKTSGEYIFAKNGSIYRKIRGKKGWMVAKDTKELLKKLRTDYKETQRLMSIASKRTSKSKDGNPMFKSFDEYKNAISKARTQRQFSSILEDYTKHYAPAGYKKIKSKDILGISPKDPRFKRLYRSPHYDHGFSTDSNKHDFFYNYNPNTKSGKEYDDHSELLDRLRSARKKK